MRAEPVRTSIALVLFVLGIIGAADAAARKRLVVFAFDQTIDAVIRIEDLNGDGDTLDAREVTRFIDDTIAPSLGVENAQGLVAISRWEVFATDNFAPDNIVHLIDMNDNGNAFDPGESVVFHDGSLPDGFTLTNPASLTRTSDGTFFVIDNNTLDATNPEAAYKLVDRNADGDVNDPNEVVLWWEFSPAGVSNTAVLELEAGPDDALYAFDISTAHTEIIRVEPDGSAAAIFTTAANLFSLSNLSLAQTMAEMSLDRQRGRLLVGAFAGSDIVICSLRDRNGNNVIDAANEIRTVWSEAASGFNTGSPRDIFWLPDNRVVWVDALSDRLWLLIDENDDGDYLDAGETSYIYDAAEASAAGQPSAPLMLSVTGVLLCVADLDEDGSITLGDLAILLANFGRTSGAKWWDGDLNGDRAVDLADLSRMLANYGESCDG